jgi:predicted RNA binding protein YcfA (HicA-like mRNA interferase family)
MGQYDKLEQKVLEGPIPVDVSYEDLARVLSHHGIYEEGGNGSSHHIFVVLTANGKHRISVPVHSKDKGINPAYIRMVRRLIEDMERDSDK